METNVEAYREDFKYLKILMEFVKTMTELEPIELRGSDKSGIHVTCDSRMFEW